MSATTFNPLTAARELEAAGIERRQAEAIAEGMREAADAAAGADREALATKTDLAEVRADLASLEARLMWRLVGIAAANVAGVPVGSRPGPSPSTARAHGG